MQGQDSRKLSQPSSTRYIFIAILLLVMVLPANQPFLTGEMPATDDGAIHVYRTIALDHAINTTGQVYPRYAPGLVYGYGSPLFNYFPPVPYYVPLGLHVLGLDYLPAWLLAMVAYSYLASWGAYLLGKQWAGMGAGIITSIAYVYAPYMLFDSIARGTIIEYAGLAGLPWVLWALTLLAKNPSRWAWWRAVMIFALFIPLHNVVTLHGAILIALYSILLIGLSERRVQTLMRLALVGIAGVALTTFFWLPALTETDAVKINVITENLSSIDVTRYLRPLGESLALPHTADITHQQAPIPITVSWASLLLMGIGTIFAWRRKTTTRWILFFVVAISSLMLFMNTPTSAWLWNNVPLLDYTQFAWRTLGIASLTIALGAGIGAYEIAQTITQRTSTEITKIVLYSVFAVLLVTYSLSWTYTRHIDLPAHSMQDVHDYERRTGELSLSSYSEYLPITNSAPPDADALQPRYAESDNIARSLHPAIQDASWRGVSAELQVSLEEPTHIDFDWLYVQGWQASYDGTSLDGNTIAGNLEAMPSPDVGLVRFELPSGNYMLNIQLQPTSRQTSANNISIIAIIVVVAVGFVLPRSSASDTSNISSSSNGLDLRLIIALGASVILVWGFKLIYVNNNATLWHTERFANGVENGLETPIFADFSNGIRLLGVDTPESAQSGDIATISLFAQRQNLPIEADYASQITLKNSEGIVIAEAGSFLPGNVATTNWLRDTYTQDNIALRIPNYTPPSTYTLHVSYYRPDTQAISSVLNEAGNPIASEIQIGTLTITRTNITPPSSRSGTSIGAIGLSLLDANDLPDESTVGDTITFSWLWKSTLALENDYQAQLVWQSGNIIVTSEIMPIIAELPTSTWQIGDTWRNWQRTIVPAQLPAGEASLSVEIVDEDGNILGDAVALATLMIDVPERVFDAPNPTYSTETTWQNDIQLIGYDVQSGRNDEGDTVTTVTLYWRTAQIITENLRLFVQVLDDESIVALDDEIPVDWTRPTTGWLPDEIITTQHILNVPNDDFEWHIGWYKATNGERIALAEGIDYAVLDNHLP
jgi:hypothetical protein